MAVKWIRHIKNFSAMPLYVKYLLESYPGETEHMLGTLTSLVRLADENGEPSFHFYHKSLLDFLRDPQRSSDLYVNWGNLVHFIKDRHCQTLQEDLNPKQPTSSSACSAFTWLIMLIRIAGTHWGMSSGGCSTLTSPIGARGSPGCLLQSTSK
ncbi:hypothetical protein FA13DRAFT_812737 [Coprinellus micaceus]|uniref:Uncharacterized protein n=1 Tax=Coprinellus micaceus TaxID=71717 RepID=A0A4Y7S415_COPMI|nr:hypothetical protein FA13DRAFT_812737 [Coprinellus micaceus]